MRRALLVLLLVLTACTAPQTAVNESNDSSVNVSDTVMNETVGNESMNDSVMNETVQNETRVIKELSVVEDELFRIKMNGETLEGVFDEVSDGRAFFRIDNETVIVEENESVLINGLNLSLKAIEPDAVVEEVGSEVSFWLGGARLTLEEGETFSRDDFNVTVLFIGRGDDGRGEAMFRVNGESVGPLSEGETDYFDNSFVMVRDVYYRRGVRQLKLDRVNLSVR